jgi:hypothetical protein
LNGSHKRKVSTFVLFFSKPLPKQVNLLIFNNIKHKKNLTSLSFLNIAWSQIEAQSQMAEILYPFFHPPVDSAQDVAL